jgi:eukaryotic-like serine/threonine-protein kinase
MAYLLMVTSGPNQGARINLPKHGSLVLGRGDESDVQVFDPRMSRTHCRIEVNGDGVRIADLGSTGGTFLQGKRIDESPVQLGDCIRIGETEATLRDEAASDTTVLSLPGDTSQVPADVRNLDALIGRDVHHYRIESKIADGTTGAVFKARDLKHNRAAAVKVLWPNLSQDEEASQRFIRGMKTMFPLHHPNIVRIYSAGTYRNLCWVAMEFVDGTDLTNLIERIGLAGMIDWQFAFRVAVQIGRALATAYDRGIIHRNITPRNILYVESGTTCKLADLMLAKALEDNPAEQLTRPGQLLGDAPYLAPERTGGDREIDCRSDIYGLGATVYALLTGRPPFEGNSLPELLQKIKNDQPVPPKRYQLAIADMFQGTVLRMLEKRPADRYQSPHALLTDLERVGSFQGIRVD